MVVEKMSSKIESEGVFFEYTEIWNKIKKTLTIRFHSQPICDHKYVKTKLKTFIGVINTAFSDSKFPKEGNHYICITATCIDSILKIDQENYS